MLISYLERNLLRTLRLGVKIPEDWLRGDHRMKPPVRHIISCEPCCPQMCQPFIKRHRQLRQAHPGRSGLGVCSVFGHWVVTLKALGSQSGIFCLCFSPVKRAVSWTD